jgi:hypothetical protein
MDIQDVIALTLVAVAIVFAARGMIAVLRGRGGCHCGSTQSRCAEGAASGNSRKARYRPLVSLNMTGHEDPGSSPGSKSDELGHESPA